MGACCGKSDQEGAVEKDRRRLSVSKSEQVVSEGNDQRANNFQQTKEGNLLELFPDANRKLSFSGQQADTTQKGFDDKKCDAQGDTDKTKPVDLGIGFACKKGLKPESPNQDDFFILSVDDWGIFGVFDGHGPYGHDVSNFVHECLPGLMVRDSSFQSDPCKTMSSTFRQCHQLCEKTAAKGRFDCSLSGTTCTVVVKRNNTLYCAHVGDSRSVLGKKEGGKFVAMDLTHDHKPENEAEKKRIHASGGQVRRLEGDIPHRVFLKGKLYPGLAMSRSIGDCIGASCGVSCDPDTKAYPIEADYRFFMLCSDGVWEFISSQEAVDIVSSHPKAQVQQAAEALAQEAWKRWIKEEGNVVDDITVIVQWVNDD